MKRIELYRQVDSCTLSIKEGPYSGQKIAHFHANIIPRFKGDLENNNEIYILLQKFDENFIISYPEMLTDDKRKIELKNEVDNIKNFMNKLYIY